MLTLLLSTAWIFGPVLPGEVELRAGAGYTQGTVSEVREGAFEAQRGHAVLGVEIGVSDIISAGILVPYQWAQHTDRSVLSYRRAELADLQLEVRASTSRNWYSGVSVSIPGHDGDDVIAQRFPITAERFPKIGRGEINLGIVFGYRRSSDRFIHAARFALETGVDEENISTSINAFSGFTMAKGWLTFGPTAGLEVTTGGTGSERVRLGLMERIGRTTGWSLELTAHTDIEADRVDATSGLSGTVVWRQ